MLSNIQSGLTRARWGFSNELPSSEGSGHTEYKVVSSKQKNGYTWDISYGDGSGAKGNVYVDKVVIGM